MYVPEHEVLKVEISVKPSCFVANSLGADGLPASVFVNVTLFAAHAPRPRHKQRNTEVEPCKTSDIVDRKRRNVGKIAVCDG